MEDRKDSLTWENECRLPEQKKQKGKRSKVRMAAAMTLTVAAVAAIMSFVVVPYARKWMEDKNARKLSEETVTREEIRKELQQLADESAFQVMVNTAPVSLDGKTADLCLINSVANRYDMEMIIQTQDGQEIFQSDILPPGGQVLVGRLTEELEPGSYPAVAVAYAVDRETGERTGNIMVDLVLTVQDYETPDTVREQ